MPGVDGDQTMRILAELFEDMFRNHVVPQWRREAEMELRLWEEIEKREPPPKVTIHAGC